MEAELQEVFDHVDVNLIEAGGGLFEVRVDGDLVFSKKALGRHAEPGEVVDIIRDRNRAT